MKFGQWQGYPKTINPPRDGGFKYNPLSGGPADGAITGQIERAANALIAAGLKGVRRRSFGEALKAAGRFDFMGPYVEELGQVIELEAVAASGLSIGVDPLGGSGIDYWEPLRERWKLNLKVVNPVVDPTFSFMTCDKDGQIRMDCSSPWAMASLIGLKD